ncbi:MAG: SDR family oxidoreductase [Phycisphaeraceae bacterium]|nr:SDR family oxidoreductase [Phycisphaeraceae bacterium]
MDLGLKNKLALVTAATKGLGRGCAEALAREGCRVAICARTTGDVQRVAGEIAAATGSEVRGYTADMAKPGDIDSLLVAVKAQLGNPDILVTNAGGPPPGKYADVKLEQYPQALELTLLSAVRLVAGVTEAMKAQGWGRILMITSIAVKQPIDTLLLSNVARSGLTGFMKTIATELAPFGITVNAVLPGLHATDRMQQLAKNQAQQKGTTPETALAEMAKTIPAGRLGTAGDFGAVVAFLASQQAGFVTGSNILVDGGAYKGLI